MYSVCFLSQDASVDSELFLVTPSITYTESSSVNYKVETAVRLSITDD